MLSEPQVYGLAKNRLIYSVVAIVVIAFVSFLEFNNYLAWFIFVIAFAFYLFIPFVYRLVVSDEAISSIHLLSTQTMEWFEIVEIYPKNSGIVLVNIDTDNNVFINSQIEDYPEVVKIIQQKRPDLWKLQDTSEFHQNIIESIFMLTIGTGLLFMIGLMVFQEGFSKDGVVLVLGMLAICAFITWTGLSKIRGISLEGNILIVKYIFWNQQFHVDEIKSVGLEQEVNKTQVNYSVHIKLKNGSQVVLQKVKEGNVILINALENWLKKYKVSSS